MDFPLMGAYAWFAGFGIAALVYGLSLIRQSPYSAWENCLYIPTYLLGRLLWRVGFENNAPLELSKGALLVANHRSSVDPFFVQLAAGRRVHWMVAKEYCNHFLFGPLLRALQVIPTNRSGMDTASTKAAIRITREDRLVGMFPEGRINRTAATLMPIRSGAAVVASKANVPMIPLLITGSPYRDAVWSPLLMSARVRITFGSAIWPDQFDVESGETNPELAASDAMILAWGRQINELAGNTHGGVELASARTRRRRRSSPQADRP